MHNIFPNRRAVERIIQEKRNMNSSGKYSLKWSQFELNMSKSFKDLKASDEFFDVTIACDDDTQIKAHKVILSASSPFFHNILSKNPHPHPLLYLKGIKSPHLVSMIDFIYNGEVTVHQEDLDKFLIDAQELKLNGLTNTSDSDKKNTNHIEHNEQKDVCDDLFANKAKDCVITASNDEKSNGTEFQPNHVLKNQLVVKSEVTEQNELQLDIGENKINTFEEGKSEDDLYERVKGSDWQCKVCQKTAKKGSIKRHVEVHIEGVSYPCHVCGRSFRSKTCLRQHQLTRHFKIFH